MSRPAPHEEAIDLVTLDRITEVLRIRDAASPQAERGAAILELRQIRNMLTHDAGPGSDDAQTDLRPGTKPPELLASLAALERTSLGSMSARRIRSRSTASRLARVLARHEQSRAWPGGS